MDFINGAERNQITILPECVEDYVDENNPVRVIEAYINNLDLEALGFSRFQPKETGRPMYNPKDMLKLYVYGYMNRVRSSRRLEAETKRNLEVIWLLGKLSPDHKTISRFRKENGVALKNVFRDFVKLCVNLGLYGKELVAIDGSKFKAVNSKDRNFTSKKIKDRISRIEARIEEYLSELDNNDVEENAVSINKSPDKIMGIINELSARKERYESYAIEMKATGESQKSLTDPESRLMKVKGDADICYNIQTSTDAKHQLITEFEVTNNAADKNQITPMIEKTKDVLEVDNITAVVDAGYDSVQDIISATGQGNSVHVAGTNFDICVLSTNTGESKEITDHENGRCVYFADRNIVLCPMGKVLYPKFYKKSKGCGVFYNSRACKQCNCKCTKELRGCRHQVPMAETDFSKKFNDNNLSIRQLRIVPDKEIISQRKSIAEHPYGTIKRTMDAGYCLTKGIKNVSGEFALTFLAYNFKRVINIMGVKRIIGAIATA